MTGCTARPLDLGDDGVRRDGGGSDAGRFPDGLQPSDASLPGLDLPPTLDMPQLQGFDLAQPPNVDLSSPFDLSGPTDLALAPPLPCTTSPQALPSTVATSFRTDPAHTGAQTADPLAPPLCLAWAVYSGTDVIGYPLVVDGKVLMPIGTMVVAADVVTGKTIWSVEENTARQLAYDGGTVYALDASGALAALSATDGSALWQTTLTGQTDFSAPPVAAGGFVYVNARGTGGTTYAVEHTAGNIVWTATTSSQVQGSPGVLGSTVYAIGGCPQAWAFDAATGTVVWHYTESCQGGIGAGATVAEGYVWDLDLAALSVTLHVATGIEEGMYRGTTQLAVDSTFAMLLDAGAGTLYALDNADDSVPWQFSGDDKLFSSPVIGNGIVVVASTAGTLFVLDEATGTLLYQTTLVPGEFASGQRASMVIAAGTLFVPGPTGLYALRHAP